MCLKIFTQFEVTIDFVSADGPIIFHEILKIFVVVNQWCMELKICTSDKCHRYYKHTKFCQNLRGDPKFLVDLTWNDPVATMKNTDNFRYEGKPLCATTKSTPFTISKDEWDTKEDTGESMKNALYVLRYAKRHMSS